MAATRQWAQPVAALGAVAQLGERLVRNEEVRGSIPLGSTTLRAEKPDAISRLGEGMHTLLRYPQQPHRVPGQRRGQQPTSEVRVVVILR